GTGGEGEYVGQHITRNIRAIDQKIPIFDDDVNVCAEDQELLRELAHCLTSTEVALERRDLLVGPVRKRMRSGGGDLEALPSGQLHHAAPQLDELRAHILRRMADGCANL